MKWILSVLLLSTMAIADENLMSTDNGPLYTKQPTLCYIEPAGFSRGEKYKKVDCYKWWREINNSLRRGGGEPTLWCWALDSCSINAVPHSRRAKDDHTGGKITFGPSGQGGN